MVLPLVAQGVTRCLARLLLRRMQPPTNPLNIYFAKTHIDNLTFHELYEEWLEYKTALCGSSNTMKRHKQRYKKYFETSVLDSMKVQSIDELLLDKECNRIVSENNLTRKEWVNAKVILNGMYDYAFRKYYIQKRNSCQDKFYKPGLRHLLNPKIPTSRRNTVFFCQIFLNYMLCGVVFYVIMKYENLV